MERLKIALLAVIAATLVVRTAGDLIPVAHAQASLRVTCEVFWVPPNQALGSTPRSMAKQLELFEPVRAWIEVHPGEVVYRSATVSGEVLVCVRG